MVEQSNTAIQLRRELESQGFVLRVEGGKLLVSPGTKLSDSQKARIACCRNDLLGLLSPYPEAVDRKDYAELLEVLNEIQAIAVAAGSRTPMDRAMRALLAVRANTMPDPEGRVS